MPLKGYPSCFSTSTTLLLNPQYGCATVPFMNSSSGVPSRRALILDVMSCWTGAADGGAGAAVDMSCVVFCVRLAASAPSSLSTTCVPWVLVGERGSDQKTADAKLSGLKNVLLCCGLEGYMVVSHGRVPSLL